MPVESIHPLVAILREAASGGFYLEQNDGSMQLPTGIVQRQLNAVPDGWAKIQGEWKCLNS